MAKTLNGKQLRSKIQYYLDRVITKPQKKLDGLPICPFAKRYAKQTHIVITDDYARTLDTVCQMLQPLGVEAVVISGYDIEYDDLEQIVNKKTRKHRLQDIEILYMHPDTVDPPLPLRYNFKYAPLIIVQRRSTLEKHRKDLKSKSKYYGKYK